MQVTDILRVLQQNAAHACKVIAHAVKTMPAERTCKCGSALQHALITDRALVPQTTIQKLEPIVGKYFVYGKRFYVAAIRRGERLPAALIRGRWARNSRASFSGVIVESLNDSFGAGAGRSIRRTHARLDSAGTARPAGDS